MSPHRIVVQARGGPEQLAWVECPTPTPARHEVRVKILAAGVAFADVMQREGVYPNVPKPPMTPGYDFIGVIDALGEGVAGWQVGQRVVALTVHGSYAETRTVPAHHLVAVPPEVDPVLAACLPLNYVTAYQMSHRVAKVPLEGKILVHGAAGGVGTALLELGKLAELTMYGCASAAKHERVRAYGAIPIDYKKEDFVARLRALEPDGVHAAFDAVGGARHFRRSFQTLQRGGVLVGYGVSGGFTEGRPHTGLSYGLLAILQVWLLHLRPGYASHFYIISARRGRKLIYYRADLTKMFELLQAGALHPVVAATLPMREARRAHEMLGHRVEGKIILVNDP